MLIFPCEYNMNRNNLFASVALFGELYKNDNYKNLGDVLADFIKGAVSSQETYSLDSRSLKDLLLKVYGFDIPESIIRTTLKTRLKNCVIKEDNFYHFDVNDCIKTKNTLSEVDTINEKQETIFDHLCNYISSKKGIENNQVLKDRIWGNLSHFLINAGVWSEYSELISGFIISNESNNEFNECLNSIKEGLILYQGLSYSDDVNESAGYWKDKITIYLSTEHLFSCVGYNGIIFKEIFDDFIGLVKEINRSEKGIKKTGIIHLKYFEETRSEIESFFQTAESIKKGYKRLDSRKVAMVSIVNRCNDIKAIKLEQVNFFIELKKLGITLQEYSYDSVNDIYNVVDQNIINSLKRTSEERKKYFDEEYCNRCLRIFTKINSYRKGINNVPFEKIKHIYITENNFAKYLGHNNKVKFNDSDITFAKDIDYIITKFWFKLKKGFKNKNNLPKTFDVLTKAKIIVSSYLNDSVSKSYEKLQVDYKEGRLTEEQAVELNSLYKEKPLVPEQIDSSNIDESLNFLEDESYVEDFLREKTRKEIEYQETLKEKESLAKELNYYKQKELEEKQKDALEKLEKDSIIYAHHQWNLYKSGNCSNLYYSFMTSFLTILPVIIGLFLKIYKPVNEWIISIGSYQLIIWAILSIIFVTEIIGRTYLFDKERIKEGWKFFSIIIKFKYRTFKSAKIHNFKEEFMNKNRS